MHQLSGGGLLEESKNFVFAKSRQKVLAIFVVALVFGLGLGAKASAATYYVDNCNVTGNDTNNGTSVSTPWLTINKVNTSSLIAGDSISFRKGCTWRETLDLLPNTKIPLS